MRTFLHDLVMGDVEHGTTRRVRWLRARWLTIGAWIAVAEGLLIVTHTIPKLIALVVALGVVAVYFSVERRALSPTARIAARSIALSQALVLFVPVLLFVLEAAAILALAVIAVVALSSLLRHRH